ncbi:unnamed protein product [Brassica napus]|uniref:(rape) hypothetical protein n=1 Tax=Brassica napus TaxID=3708 RepID=A0A816JNH4_BRANA|nr:unnamed protein product [Brassica napus]
MRSNFPSDLVWRSLSISIAFLLSCGAVCSGPEDATDFVSTIFRGADWRSTSHYKVTISQASGCAMNLASTHLSFALNSLSHYFKDGVKETGVIERKRERIMFRSRPNLMRTVQSTGDILVGF